MHIALCQNMGNAYSTQDYLVLIVHCRTSDQRRVDIIFQIILSHRDDNVLT